jgi:lipoate-protein ligase B
MPVLRWQWLGRVPYREACALQESLRRRILDGEDAERLLLLEHDPVVTLGRGADAKHLLAPAELTARGIAVEPSTRGGQVTYHGPGQLVAYAVVRIGSVVAHVEALCAAAVAVAEAYGVSARYRRDCPGVWVPHLSEERKLASVGVHVSRRVALHGLALNVSTALEPFSLIVACGTGARPTSLAVESGRTVTPREVAPAYAAALATALGRLPVEPVEEDPLLSVATPLE